MQDGTSAQQGYSSKSWETTAYLAIFLGGLGADHFYLGRVGTGILKLITCGGFGIWSIIDIIGVVGNTRTDAQGLRLRRS